MDGGEGTPPSRLATEFPTIAQLPREDMREIINESMDPHVQKERDAYFDALLHTLPEMQALYDEHQQLLEEVECAAEYNMELRPVLEAVRNDTRAAFEQARETEDAWPAVEREMTEAYKLEMNHVHDESEVLANAYVEGLPAPGAGAEPIDVRTLLTQDTEFVRQYRALRTLYHRRALLLEQCTHQRVQWRT